MKLKFSFVPVMLLNISCAPYELDTYHNKNSRPQFAKTKKLAHDAYRIINNKFDNNRITLSHLSDTTIAAYNIKKIIDLTSDMLEKEIPHALRAVDKAEAGGLTLRGLREKIISIQEKIIAARQRAAQKAEEGAKIASLKASAEKDKGEKAQESLANSIVDAKFVQTNMPKVSRAQAARDRALAELKKTQAYFHALENFWVQEALKKNIAKTKAYVESAENSAKEADIFAKNAHECYQSIVQKNKNLAQQDRLFNVKNLILKASNDVESAELAVQELQIKTMLSLRLYSLDPRNIYKISQAIENSVQMINLASASLKAVAHLGIDDEPDIALAKTKLQKSSASFESYLSTVSETLIKIAKDTLLNAQNSGADKARTKTAQKVLDIVVDNLRLSAKHLKNFGTSLAYKAMKAAYNNAKKFKPLARKAVT